MYNRYIHNDNGTYTRIQEEDPPRRPNNSPPHESQSPPQQEQPSDTRQFQHQQQSQQQYSSHSDRTPDGLTGFLRHILDQLHLDSIDTGDLILLGLLFFLSREDADEELLIALGLLLIL